MHLRPGDLQHFTDDKVLATAGSNPFSFISSSISSSLTPSLEAVLSPKLPRHASSSDIHSNNNHSSRSANARRRLRANSLTQFRAPRLSTWLRWTILGLVVIMMLFQIIVRNSETVSSSEVVVSGRNSWRWAVSRWRPTKVAIYCGPGTDFDNVNSLIYSLSLEGLKERVAPSLYAEHTGDLSKLSKGQRENPRSFAEHFSKPLSLLRTGQQKQDIILVPPSRNSLDALPILHNQKQATLIFVVKDPNRFIAQAMDHPGLPILQEYFDEERVSFLLVESRHRLPFLALLHDLLHDEDHGGPSVHVDVASRVHSYTPLMDIARVPVKKIRGRRREFYYYSLFYTDSSESTVNYINKLIIEFGHWLRKDYESLGYKIVQDSASGNKALKRSRYKQNDKGGKEKVYSVALHIFLPFYLSREVKTEMIAKLRVPVSIRPAVHFHTDDSADALYTKVARSHLLLPSHPYEYPASNTSNPAPYDPAIPIAITSRLRILMPHSLEASYSSFLTVPVPALISYPDEPGALQARDRAMPLFEAVNMVKNDLTPRRNLAITARPWVTVDKEPFWLVMQKKIDAQNVEAFVEMLKL